MAAVRRSLFDNAERAKFLNHVVTGVKRILQQNAQAFIRLFFKQSSHLFIILHYAEFKRTKQLPRILPSVGSTENQLPTRGTCHG